MNDKELWELMSIICEGQNSEQRRKVEQYITDLQKETERLQEELKDLNRILCVWNSRKLINKFNKEYDKEDLEKNPNREYVVIYPDAEEVYKRYYKQKAIIKEVREKIKGVKKINNEVYKQTDMLERFYSRKWCNDKMDNFLEILDKENK